MKILIVEDNDLLSDNIAKYLELEGIKSKQLKKGKRVNYELIQGNFDLIILDLGLPDMDGLMVCQEIRNNQKNIPILMLTARTTIEEKSQGFNAGADDYLTKPFNYEELLLRIKALIRRDFSVKSNVINIGKDIILNITEKKLSIKDKPVHLSNLEMELLIYLVQNKSKVISKEELLEKVWGEYDEFNMTRTVDVYMGYLRKKIGNSNIETVRGKGYIFN